MRYRLRTLMLAAILGPPILALLWFLAIWARFPLPGVIGYLIQPLLLPGMLAVLALVGYSAAAPLPRDTPSVSLVWWQCAVLWICLFLAEWQWFYILIGLGGWMLVWGDNGPPVPDATLARIAGLAAAAGASLAVFRIALGLATKTYVAVVLSLAMPLLSLAFLFWLGVLLR